VFSAAIQPERSDCVKTERPLMSPRFWRQPRASHINKSSQLRNPCVAKNATPRVCLTFLHSLKAMAERLTISGARRADAVKLKITETQFMDIGSPTVVAHPLDCGVRFLFL